MLIRGSESEGSCYLVNHTGGVSDGWIMTRSDHCLVSLWIFTWSSAKLSYTTPRFTAQVGMDVDQKIQEKDSLHHDKGATLMCGLPAGSTTLQTTTVPVH